MKTAVIAGATGLVGGELLTRLLEDTRYSTVLALTRRDFSTTHPKLKKIAIDYHHPGNVLSGFVLDDIFCCLGTTMAKAKSREKFYEVDFYYPLALAKATHALGAKQYFLVSALGADKNSAIYYNRVKGEVEEAIRKVGFQSLHIFRPSLLLGPRQEMRVGEDVAKLIYRIFGFLIPGKYKAIEAGTVARAMILTASEEKSGVFVHESQNIRQCGATPA